MRSFSTSDHPHTLGAYQASFPYAVFLGTNQQPIIPLMPAFPGGFTRFEGSRPDLESSVAHSLRLGQNIP